MAIRGTRPTPTVVRLATGNPGKRPLPKDEPLPQGPLVKPQKIRGRAAALWDEVAGVATWLTSADGYKLHVWCELHAEFERSPRRMVAARIGQLRAAGSELGLDPTSRARLGKTDSGKKQDPAEQYFAAG